MLLFPTGRPECEAISPLLSPYLDGQLSSGEKERVLRHLATCAACNHELESLRDTVALVHDLPALPVPRPFTLRAAPLEQARGWLFYLRTATATATACLLAVLMLIVTAPGGGRYTFVAPAAENLPASATLVAVRATPTTRGLLEVSPTVMAFATATFEPQFALQPAAAPPEEPAEVIEPAKAASPAAAAKIGVQAEMPAPSWPLREIAYGLLGLVLGLGGVTLALGRRQGRP